MTVENFSETILKNCEYFTSLITDINSAKISIDLEVYIFNFDRAGNILADELCKAAKRGVKVRLLVDGIGTPDWGNPMTLKMEAAGVETRIYHPIPWFISQWHRHHQQSTSLLARILHLLMNINSRNHRKSCLIDSNIAYAGSANITNHLLADDKDIWRETTVRIANTNTDDLLDAFEQAWNHIKPKKTDSEGIFLFNYNWKLRHRYYKFLLNQISNSKSRLFVTNAYFSPDSRLLKKLIQSKKRGIDVKILLPHFSDVMIMSFAAKIFYPQLLKHGIEIYEYLPCVLHAKSLIIDDWYLVGSSNINYRSLRHDLELNVSISSNDAKKNLDLLFENDLAHAKKISLDDVARQPWYQYLFGRLVLFFRYLI